MIRKIGHIILIALFLIGCKAKQNTSSNGNSSVESKRDLRIKEILIQATTEKILGNDANAEKLFLDILTLDQNTAVAHFELSEIYQKKRDANKTVFHAKKAVDLAPENGWYLASLASVYRQTNQLDLAAQTYQKLLKKEPTNTSYLFSLAEIYLYQGKLKESLPLYNRIEAQMGVSEEMSMHKNKIYIELNQPDSAIAEINKLIKNNPQEVRYYGMLAELYENKGQEAKALELYKKILEIEPDNGFVHLSLSEYYKYHSQKDKSDEELTIAFKSPKVDVLTKVEILSEYFVNSERNEDLKKRAYELCDITIEVHPKESKGYAVYTDFLARDYRDAEAIRMLSKAVELDPANYNMAYQLMMLLVEAKDYESLVAESNKAAELFPTQATFYYFNGIGNIQLKKYKEAVDALEVGKDLVLNNQDLKGEFYQYLGDANHFLNEHGQSDYYYDQALAIDPTNVYVLNNYSYYLSLRKEQLPKAEQMALKTNQLQPNNATYLDTYGWVLYQAGKYVDAEVWLQKALDNGGGSSGEVLEHYGDALFKLGKKEKALEYWQKAAEKTDVSKNIRQKIENKELID